MHTPAHRSVDQRGRRIAGSPAQRSWLESAAVALLLAAASGMPALAGDLPGACEAETPNGKPFDITVSGEFNTDYVYRGITLSAHQPAVGAKIEVDRGPLYFTFEPHSVKLPTNLSAELGFSGGFCKAVNNITIDLGATYLYYPGEIPVGPVTSTSYWEGHATISVPVGTLTLAATYAYSPNYSNTGAWEHYVEGNFELDLPKVLPKLLGKDIEWSLSGSVGRSWFGTQSASLGGFPLPGYTYWSLGISFTYEAFTLDLTYTNTNLTKENCFVFTGDPNAVPGGAIDLVTNPQGLRSNWCGPAFVATLSAQFPPGK
jgi:uncharacterized protein (TIGR02001 family)